jgi:peptidyl-prolyl cis-trans isomerase C
MKTWKSALLIAVMATLVAGCSRGTSSGKVLAEVGGTKITEGDLAFLGQINPRIQQQIEVPDGKQRILDNLVEQDLLYQKAVKEGINRDAVVKAKVDLYRRVIIAQALVEKQIEKAAKKYYDEHQDEFKKLRMSQIEVKFATPDQLKAAKKGKEAPKMHSEDEALKLANDLKARLDKGEAFDAVAKDASEDMLTKARGGDMGPVSKDDKRFEARGFAPLIEKAYEMKVGEVAGPMKTTEGYHLITVTKGLELEPFEEAKAMILFKVQGDARQNLLAELKKETKVVFPEQEAAKKKAGETAKPGEAAKAPEQQPPAAGEAKAPALEVKPATPAKAPEKAAALEKKVEKQVEKKAAEKPAKP